MTTNFYIIPGIYDPVDDARDWDYQAQAWLHERFPASICDGFNYSDDIIGGNVWLGTQAAKIAEDLAQSRARGNRIVIVGHSNGCRLALKALELAPEVEGVSLHLIAAACDEDCRVNGLNRAVEAHQLDRRGGVTLYVSPVDEVLGLGPLVSYGELGKLGPAYRSMGLEFILQPQVTRQCGHSDWVTKDFQSTMEAIAAAEDRTTENTEGTETTAKETA